MTILRRESEERPLAARQPGAMPRVRERMLEGLGRVQGELRLPAETASGSGLYQIRTLPFDRWMPETPYEERHVIEEDQFASLPERFQQLAGSWPFPTSSRMREA